ncbi:hypothetical protein [Aeromonas caviae]|uniref:hypothetical protein n=1 Tax=Aeromonas caviae TaxID=648 RepID=UPI001FB9D9C5|nr:hypothetical protein [Aeromonas caviae]GKQ69041.1 hypothetical protein KAM371_00460 [Aeromonas caviae]GKQ83429.1 hypothetical protein KAM449_11760 [Aeromonas caviae]GKQ92075.1 hypothetical protein KAM451_08410 [Aeromonas caviae]
MKVTYSSVDFASRIDVLCSIFGVDDALSFSHEVFSLLMRRSYSGAGKSRFLSYLVLKKQIIKIMGVDAAFQCQQELVGSSRAFYNSRLYYRIGMVSHCFERFDIPDCEAVIFAVLSEFIGAGVVYVPLFRRFRNEWLHHAFVHERQKLSPARIAKKYGLGERYVLRCIAGRWS